MKNCGTQVGIVCLLLVVATTTGQAQSLRIRDICRVKGQEENTLHGMGLVVGLKGTGDTDGPTLRALAKMLESMGSPLGQLGKDAAASELKNAKNVAMVMVTATIPPEGARQGEQLNCTVSAVGAKSLAGGMLVMTPLVGPRPGNPRIYALAQGPLTISESGPPTVAVVHDGCRLEEDFTYQFSDEEWFITLVIDRHHAGFPTAYEIKEALSGMGGSRRTTDAYGNSSATRSTTYQAQALDPVNVRVRIPAEYQNYRVDFIAEVLDTPIALQHHDARVVINERNGVIIIGDNVTIGRVAVTHKNVSIETGDEPARGPLIEIDQSTSSPTTPTRLKALVEALNALKVDSQAIIDIIKSLERSGDLYGRLVIE
jgi:flagellar P-ring protein FlgI